MSGKYLRFVLGLICLTCLVGCGVPIGTVRGAENEQLIIDGMTYIKTQTHDFSIADRGKYLGTASNGKIAFRVYAVEGNDDYRYAFWDWEGDVYVREKTLP